VPLIILLFNNDNNNKVPSNVQIALTIADAALSQRLIKTLAQSDVVLILCTVDELLQFQLARSRANALL